MKVEGSTIVITAKQEVLTLLHSGCFYIIIIRGLIVIIILLNTFVTFLTRCKRQEERGQGSLSRSSVFPMG